MYWRRGLKRLRIVGTVALLLSAILVLTSVLTNALGYAPDAGFVGVFSFLIHLSLPLMILGIILWTVVWIIQGFLPETMPPDEPTRARFRG